MYAVLVHGYTGNGDYCWFPKLKAMLDAKGVIYSSPSLPNTMDPKWEEWRDTLAAEINEKWDGKSPIFMLGFSLGGFTVLSMLTEFKNEPWVQHVTHVMLVAPVTSFYINTWEFVNRKIDWDFIRAKDVQIRMIYSLDDKTLPQSEFEHGKKELAGAKDFQFLETNGYQHFSRRLEAKHLEDLYQTMLESFVNQNK